ncbi:MAG: xanthine dehydrogenase family protein molybdopterin-binding subunit [Pyrinomonadaceae bacterium]|nr:xanthine dehydrogenase family protein molybdopterin-binding subunit [Pyrinomonadaceae bacterium]
MRYIGKEMSRVDGVAKVTGKAKYVAEFPVKNPAYGFIVTSEIAKGTITSMNTRSAENSAGVLKVYTHSNTLKTAAKGNAFAALQSPNILFSNQPIALVVADTYEQARYAASLIEVKYSEEKPQTDTIETNKQVEQKVDRRNPPTRGNPQTGLANSDVRIEAEYTIPIEHHNPMEMHGAIAFWEGDKLMVFDKSQGVYGVRGHLAQSFGIPTEKVSVVSLFVGGAFGSSLKPNYYPFITAMAAKDLKRPVKLNYTRRQMFTGHGYRPFTHQKIKMGAGKDGKLQAVTHESISNTATYENFSENSTGFGRTLYKVPNYDTKYNLVKTDLPTPVWMRAPGAVSGAFAIESAIDELAYKLKIDPLEMRRINYAEKDPESGKPYSSKELMKCFDVGAEKFGWSKRKLEPRSMKDGNWLVGMGCGIGTWGAWQAPAGAKVTLRADGTVHIGSATADIGPGTYTTMTIIASEFLGVTPDKVKFELGKTDFPRAPSQGGSVTTASVGSAIYGAAMNIKKKLLAAAKHFHTEMFKTATVEDVELVNGYLRMKNDKSESVPVTQLFEIYDQKELVEIYQAMPSKERANYTTMGHGIQFAEVKVDEDLGIVKVTKVIEATACGRVVNPLTAHSQEMGGMIWGIGMALHEDTQIDHRYGRMMTTNFADYHIPSNADVNYINTEFVEEEDKIVNPLGVKGMGELCLVGAPAAIANAIFNATGKRIRDLPITPDKLI